MVKIRGLLLALAVLALVCLAWLAYETNRFTIEQVEVRFAGLPASFDGFRIAQVTDIHGRPLSPNGPVIAAVAVAEPDVIALTGDYVRKSPAEMDSVIPFLRALSSIAPAYGVSGNHDHWAGWEPIASVLDGCGITVLMNDHVVLERGQDRIILAGVGDPVTKHDDLEAALPPHEDPGLQAPTVVLLVHSPTWWETRKHGVVAGGGSQVATEGPRAPSAGTLGRAALALAGHTHGGQVRLPVIGAFSNASGRMLPRDYVSGLSVEDEGTVLYISRGLGFSILPVRFLAPAEITVVTLRRAD